MIEIDKTIVSLDVVTKNFACDLNKCKGACCVEGDCGAPLTGAETIILAEIYPKIKPYLTPDFIKEIEVQGTHTTEKEHGYVTPTINGGICVYGLIDATGNVTCGIEKAWKAGITDFQKPISCHLFPVRITEYETYDAVNYEPRADLCSPACQLGKRLKVPVYQFLKDSLIRKYGEEFYKALDAAANNYEWQY